MNKEELKDLARIVARFSELEKQLWEFWKIKEEEFRSSASTMIEGKK